MFRLRIWIPVLVAGIVTGGWLVGQDKDKDKDIPPKARQLPKNWKKLGLTDEQVTAAKKVQNKFGNQIDQLEQRIKDLKKEESAELEKILTAAQKDRLKEILLGTVPDKDKDKEKDKEKPKDKDTKDKDKDSKDKGAKDRTKE